MTLEHVIPFFFRQKIQMVPFLKKFGTYLMGLDTVPVSRDNQRLTERCQAYAEDGLRVLVFGA